MALICWSRNLTVGSQDLDQQHQVLADTLNDLDQAMMMGGEEEHAEQMLRNLLAITCEHFAAEETILANAGCGALETHRARHRELVRKIELYLQRCERGEVTFHVHLMNFLRDWLRMHIERVERAFRSEVAGSRNSKNALAAFKY